MPRYAWILLTLAATVLSACSDDDGPTGPAPDASYTATVRGALSATLTGQAFFGADTNDEGEPVFAIALGDSTSEHVMILARTGASRPATGTYTVENPLEESSANAWTALHIVGEEDELVAMFIATSGRLTITESSAERLKGTFEYVGAAVTGDDTSQDPVEITVTGSFDAAPATATDRALRAAIPLP